MSIKVKTEYMTFDKSLKVIGTYHYVQRAFTNKWKSKFSLAGAMLQGSSFET